MSFFLMKINSKMRKTHISKFHLDDSEKECQERNAFEANSIIIYQDRTDLYATQDCKHHKIRIRKTRPHIKQELEY